MQWQCAYQSWTDQRSCLMIIRRGKDPLEIGRSAKQGWGPRSDGTRNTCACASATSATGPALRGKRHHQLIVCQHQDSRETRSAVARQWAALTDNVGKLKLVTGVATAKP